MDNTTNKDMTKIKVVEIKPDTSDVIKLSQAYQFDGREITEIDLSGLKNVTMKDYNSVRTYLTNKGVVVPANMAEMDPLVANAYAAIASHLPFEFFDELNIKDGYKVKNKVMGFIYATE